MSRPLTRREQFAKEAMGALIVSRETSYKTDDNAGVEVGIVGNLAVTYADCTIAQLDYHPEGHECDDCRNAEADALVAELDQIPIDPPEPTALEAAQQVETDRQKNRAEQRADDHRAEDVMRGHLDAVQYHGDGCDCGDCL